MPALACARGKSVRSCSNTDCAQLGVSGPTSSKAFEVVCSARPDFLDLVQLVLQQIALGGIGGHPSMLARVVVLELFRFHECATNSTVRDHPAEHKTEGAHEVVDESYDVHVLLHDDVIAVG